MTAAVQVRRSAFQWNQPGLMTCSMASKLWDFETKVVQPAAQREFGHSVRKMSNLGSYSCRNIRSERGGGLSEHARGLAIDISGFELDDGTLVSVLRDWQQKGPKGAFLHQIAAGACGIFTMVLSPNHNALHSNHLHLDIGPHKHCG